MTENEREHGWTHGCPRPRTVGITRRAQGLPSGARWRLPHWFRRQRERPLPRSPCPRSGTTARVCAAEMCRHQSPAPVWVLVTGTAHRQPLCSAFRRETEDFNTPSRTHTPITAFLTAPSRRDGSRQDVNTGRSSAWRWGPAHAGRSVAWQGGRSHLPVSGCRLSSRHLSCSSPRWILSSSSRCSMTRADFIFTKYS